MGDDVTIVELRSKWVKVKGHFPSLFGYAAVIVSLATLISAVTVGVVAIMAVSMGQPVDFACCGGYHFFTTPPPSVLPTPPKPEEPKKEAAPVTGQVAPVANTPPPAVAETIVANVPHDLSSTHKKPTTTSSGVPRLKRDYGTFQLEVPVQGDVGIDETDRGRRYMRHGVMFRVYTIRCRPPRMMPQVCYGPKDEPRPIVRGW